MGRFGRGFGALAWAAAAFAVPALAADMTPPSYYPPAPLPPAAYNWTGFYIGGHVGAGLLEDHVSQTPGSAPTVSLTGPSDISAAALIGGGQIGLNYQFASWVIGAEASWTDSDISGSALTSVAGGGTTTQERATSNPQWFAAATGRFGYAANDLLFYAKGGGAWMHVNYIQDALLSGITGPTQSISDNRTGYTAGLGLEYGMTENLSAKFEYDFYDFGTKNYAFSQTPVAIVSKIHALTVGLNYRFNWAGGWH